jgi:hypothetical protein
MLANRADRILLLEEGRLVPHISTDSPIVERENSK